MTKRGRPKVKKSEFKKPFPMRFSDAELKAFKAAAGHVPVREWMRKTLLAAVGIISEVEKAVQLAELRPPSPPNVHPRLGKL